ncbi:MAG: exosome complex protein Rrp42 [Candidatus Hadarchaeia archaeon]
MSQDEIISTVKKDYIQDLAEEGKRVDARAMDQYREIDVETGWVENSAGSALVRLDNTQVLAGITLEVGTPYPDKPESGVLITNAELAPMAHASFEAGPPGEEATELARVVDRGIRESEMIALDELCIEPEEEVWMVYVDIHVLDHDGNLIDASSLAAIAALLSAEAPEDEENWNLDGFPVSEKPITTTFAKIGDALMIDPSLVEENVMDARFTISTLEDGHICAMQKGGSGPLDKEDFLKAQEWARDKSEELRKKVEQG